MIIEYPAKSYERCTKKQLLTVAYALEAMRDRAVARAEKAEAAIERVRAIHTPVPVYTQMCDYSDYNCDRPHVEDRDGYEYHKDGPTEQVCAVCSENEEYSPGIIPWPCPTLEALGGDS